MYKSIYSIKPNSSDVQNIPFHEIKFLSCTNHFAILYQTLLISCANHFIPSKYAIVQILPLPPFNPFLSLLFRAILIFVRKSFYCDLRDCQFFPGFQESVAAFCDSTFVHLSSLLFTCFCFFSDIKRTLGNFSSLFSLLDSKGL